MENGLDADDGIENIRPCVSFKCRKALQVEDVVLGGLVAEVAIFEGGHGNEACSVLHFLCAHHLVLRDLLTDIVGDLADETLQAHDAALPRLKGFAVLPVHGAKAKMLENHVLRHQSALARSTEDLLKVQRLALIGEVEHLVGLEVLHALHQCGKIRGGIEGRTVGLHQDARRHLLGVALLLDIHHQGTLGLCDNPLGLHGLEHGRDIGLRVALPQPDIKVHIQIVIVFPKIFGGNPHDMLPHGAIAPIAGLQAVGCVMRPAGKVLIHLALGTGSGIDLLQLRDGEGRLGGIFSRVGGIKIGKLRMTLVNLLYNQAHLQSPVTHVDVSNDLVAEEAVNALDALSDDGRAQMSHMERLGHIGAAIVEHNGLGRSLRLHAEGRRGGHTRHIVPQNRRTHRQVEEAGLYRLHL